jgi:UDP-N-acetylglucosamine transferase subunit ALG13
MNSCKNIVPPVSAFSSPFVFVTVGTDHHPFDRLIHWVDDWLASKDVGQVHCLAQVGTSAPPHVAAWKTYLDYEEMEEAMRRAAVVVCHGGPATIMDSRRMATLPIVVPRCHEQGEHVDNHQVAFARWMAEHGQVELAESEEALRRALDCAFEQPDRYRLARSDTNETQEAVERFSALVNGLFADGGPEAQVNVSRPHSWRRSQRVAGRIISRFHSSAVPTAGPGSAGSGGEQPPDDRLKLVFIGGIGRSGSTLLDRMLGQVPGFFSTGEMVHIWQGILGNDLCGCGMRYQSCSFWDEVIKVAFNGWEELDPEALMALQARVDRNRRIPLMLVPRLSKRYDRELQEYLTNLHKLYRGIQEVSGADFVVDSAKHASYAYLLRRIPSIDLHLVHLVRDVRGVAYSWTKQMNKSYHEDASPMARYHPCRIGARWLVYNGLFHLLSVFGVPSLLVHYETLVARPRNQLEDICRFLGRRPEDEDFSFVGDQHIHLGTAHTVDGNPMRFFQGRLELSLDEAWRSSLGTRHRILVTALTWPLLRGYGYEVRCKSKAARDGHRGVT